MNDHNNNGNNDHSSSMMWMMVICCAVPFVFLLIAGRLVLPGWGWLVGLGVLGMMGFHFWQMRKHGGHMGSNNDMPGQDGQNINPEQKNTDEHEHH